MIVGRSGAKNCVADAPLCSGAGELRVVRGGAVGGAGVRVRPSLATETTAKDGGLSNVVKNDNIDTMRSATTFPRATSASDALKAAVAARIVATLDRAGLTLREAEARTGQAAGDFSRLRNGRLERFTIDRLLTIAEALGDRISVSLAPQAHPSAPVPRPLAPHLRELRSLCRRFDVARLAAFGSVTRDDFDPATSDLDLVVEFRRSRTLGPADQYFRFKAALERLFDRQVDLVELKAMQDSRLKRSIERTQVPVYGEGA
jgi:predicted nucleotidyltransferase/predicted XRE-type DNA-binding protein